MTPGFTRNSAPLWASEARFATLVTPTWCAYHARAKLEQVSAPLSMSPASHTSALPACPSSHRPLFTKSSNLASMTTGFTRNSAPLWARGQDTFLVNPGPWVQAPPATIVCEPQFATILIIIIFRSAPCYFNPNPHCSGHIYPTQIQMHNVQNCLK